MNDILKTILAVAFLLSQTVSDANANTIKLLSPQFKKVIVIFLENTNYQDAMAQPFLGQLAKKGALFTQCSAEGHPSQPNYVAAIAGDPLGVKSDSPVSLSGNHIGDLLNQKGLTWKVYAEDYPGNCFLGATSGKYARKHVPFLSFKDIQTSPEQCAKVVDTKAFDQDVSNKTLPNLSFYVPNLDHDGHDTGVSVADQWLSQTFGDKIADPSFMSDTLIVVTFDEAERVVTGNQVYTVFVGANVTPGSTVASPTSHYSILKTIEDNFSLGNLGRNDSKAASVTGIWH